MGSLIASGIAGVVLGAAATASLGRLHPLWRGLGVAALCLLGPWAAAPVFQALFPDRSGDFFSGLGTALLWLVFVLGLWAGSLVIALAWLMVEVPRHAAEQRAAKLVAAEEAARSRGYELDVRASK